MGLEFQPKFDAEGLIGAVATDAESGEVLMFAWMNAEALSRSTIDAGAHFWSRSRGRLWKKGEESGNVLHIVEISGRLRPGRALAGRGQRRRRRGRLPYGSAFAASTGGSISPGLRRRGRSRSMRVESTPRSVMIGCRDCCNAAT